jgi:hypothetical protein
MNFLENITSFQENLPPLKGVLVMVGSIVFFILTSLITMRGSFGFSLLRQIAPEWAQMAGNSRGCMWVMSKLFGLAFSFVLTLIVMAIIASYLKK